MSASPEPAPLDGHGSRPVARAVPGDLPGCVASSRCADPADPRRGVLSAAAPDFAIPGGSYDESFLADVVVNKVAMRLPLYRQEERLLGLDIEVSRQTLSRLYIASADALRPLYLRMKALRIAGGVIFTDDTPVQLQVKGPGKTVTGRMWVYVAGGAGPPWRVHESTVDRLNERPKESLGPWTHPWRCARRFCTPSATCTATRSSPAPIPPAGRPWCWPCAARRSRP